MDVPIPAISRKIAAADTCQPGPSSQPDPPFAPRPDSSVPKDFTRDYHLIPLKNLMRAVGVFTCCGSPLTVSEDRKARRGFVSKLMISCTVCGKSSAITDPYQEEDQEVNTRSFLAARMTGQGRARLVTFAGMMGMLPPLHNSNYLLHNTKILVATRDATEANMLDAAAHLRKKANAGEDEVIDAKVTCDAT